MVVAPNFQGEFIDTGKPSPLAGQKRAGAGWLFRLMSAGVGGQDRGHAARVAFGVFVLENPMTSSSRRMVTVGLGRGMSTFNPHYSPELPQREVSALDRDGFAAC